MAKLTNKLSATFVLKSQKNGYHHDGRGLYLRVAENNQKSWFYRYRVDGKNKWHGLGGYPDVSLLDARTKADECRKLRNNNIDPINNRKSMKIAKNIPTFSDCAESYIDIHQHSWKNEKHIQGWRNTLKTYAYPVFGDLYVSDIDLSMIMKVIKPIWITKTDTANRVRQRIESILDWAAVHEYRSNDNPARWHGYLNKLLPDKSSVKTVQHYKAMPYAEIPGFYNKLRKHETISAKALAFLILTCSRSNEVRCAMSSEIDHDNKIWTIPEERMKNKKIHRVPLNDDALNIIEEMHPFSTEFIFPGLKINTPISNNTMRKLLQGYFKHDATPHGFRSTFRDWCAEKTTFPREVVELCLAHSVINQTEAAYQRRDLLERRREIMGAWLNYCLNGDKKADVIPINQQSNGR